MKRICIVQGHPTPGGGHFCHALADAYAGGAAATGHEVKRITVAEIEFPLLRSKQDWDSGQAPPAIASAQETIRCAEHLVLIHPLWIGMMPALIYRWYFGAHGLKSLTQNLALAGIKPSRYTLIGNDRRHERQQATQVARVPA